MFKKCVLIIINFKTYNKCNYNFVKSAVNFNDNRKSSVRERVLVQCIYLVIKKDTRK